MSTACRVGRALLARDFCLPYSGFFGDSRRGASRCRSEGGATELLSWHRRRDVEPAQDRRKTISLRPRFSPAYPKIEAFNCTCTPQAGADTAVRSGPPIGASANMDSEVIVETRNLSKVYRDFWGRQTRAGLEGPRSGNPPRRNLRAVGTQRLGQDDHDQAAVGIAVSRPAARRWSSAAMRPTSRKTNGWAICPRSRTCIDSSTPKRRWTSTAGCSTCPPRCANSGPPS